MKKIFIIFFVLVLAFIGVWVTKSKTPANRAGSYENGYSNEQAWWTIDVDTSEVDTKWKLDPEIPDNYLPVPGEDELYMVIDENGNIIKYRKRTQQADGTWVWEDVNPDIPENYEPVEGLEDVYKVTYEDGTVKYYKYIRNDDDTYAFVEVDENGNLIGYDDPEGSEIPDNYEHLTGNVYAVEDENGVVIAYKERTMDDDGNYIWSWVQKPTNIVANIGEGTTSVTQVMENPYTLPSEDTLISDSTSNNGTNGGSYITNSDVDSGYTYSEDSYTDTETYLTTETEDGWEITYQTTITKTYDSAGNLLSTKKDGPTEISRTQITSSDNTGSADSGSIAATLSEEVARITVGVSFDDSIANSILSLLNAERASAGLLPLSMDYGDAYNLSRARAAAMAQYDYSDYNSPIYGSLSNMCMTYGISSGAPSENSWRASSDKTAEAINSRFMTIEASKNNCLSSSYSSVGISVAVKNGYLYISEVFLN